MIRTYWLLALASVALALAAELASPGLAVVAVFFGFLWWDSAPSGGER